MTLFKQDNSDLSNDDLGRRIFQLPCGAWYCSSGEGDIWFRKGVCLSLETAKDWVMGVDVQLLNPPKEVCGYDKIAEWLKAHGHA